MSVNSFHDYPMTWKPDLSNCQPPLYKSLARLLEEDIRSQKLHPGDMLPPQRELADYLDINLSTVSKAFKYCEQKGLISATVGKGTFVSSDANISATMLDFLKDPIKVNLGPTLPIDDTDPMIISAMQKALTAPDAGALLQYNFPCGTPAQKKTGANWLKALRFDVAPNNVIFSSGGQNALSGILLSLFQPGDILATTSVIYPGLKTLANMLGIKLLPVDLKKLSFHFNHEDIKGLYLISDCHNPLTTTLTPKEREEISSICHSRNVLLIEDGISSMFLKTHYPPAVSYHPDNGIYISSLSKCLSPGLRTAILAVPQDLVDRIELSFYNLNMMASPFLTQVSCQLIESGEAFTIIEQKKEDLQKRNLLVNKILGDYVVLGDTNSLFRFLILPDEIEGKSFEFMAKSKGVICYCSQRFAVGNVPYPSGVRLSITACRTLKELEQGLWILRSILESENDTFTMM